MAKGVRRAQPSRRTHDFRLFKSSGVRFHPTLECLADKGFGREPLPNGYQGLAKFHRNSRTPHKKAPRAALSAQQRRENRHLAQQRVVIEHVNGYLKRFRILAERYRIELRSAEGVRHQRFALRFNLIAGLYNYELALTC